MRRIAATSTPLPSCAPAAVLTLFAGIDVRPRRLEHRLLARVAGVFAFAMLWPVTSIACCCVSRPRSEVWRPKKAEIVMPAGRVRAGARAVGGGAVGAGAARIPLGRVGAVVAGADGSTSRSRWSRNDELLAHQRLVARVLARQLGEQAAAARRCGAVASAASSGVISAVSWVSVTACGREAEQRAGAGEQPGAVLLEARAALQLGLEGGDLAHDAVDVLRADRDALGEDGCQQALGRLRAAPRGGRARRRRGAGRCGGADRRAALISRRSGAGRRSRRPAAARGRGRRRSSRRR